jgi:hypothetical protein
MYYSEHEPIALLVEVTPKLAKKRFRDEIYKSWNHKCAYCGEGATSLDHVVPRYKSGETTRKNLVPACRRCNTSKASEKLHEWYLKQDFFCEAKLNRIERWTSQNPYQVLHWEKEAEVSLVHRNYVGQTQEGCSSCEALPERQDEMQFPAAHSWA